MRKIIGVVSVIIILSLFSGCVSTRGQAKEEDTLSLEGLKNLIENPGFEDGAEPWKPFGFGSIESTAQEAHSGGSSILVTGRTNDWEGAGCDMESLFEKGHTYIVAAWVKLANSDSASFKITVKRATDTGDNYDNILQAVVKGEDWIELKGKYTLPESSGTFNELTLYIEGPKPGIEYFIDDVTIAQIGPEKILE